MKAQAWQAVGSWRETVRWSQASQYQTGNAVTPPELSADAPVPDVVHPVEVDLGETVGDYSDSIFCDGTGGSVGHGSRP